MKNCKTNLAVGLEYPTAWREGVGPWRCPRPGRRGGRRWRAAGTRGPGSEPGSHGAPEHEMRLEGEVGEGEVVGKKKREAGMKGGSVGPPRPGQGVRLKAWISRCI